MLLLSLAAHGLILTLGTWQGTAPQVLLQPATTSIEVTLVEPEPEPVEPDPLPPEPEPTPEPPPPILTTPEPVEEALPEPTPEPSPEPTPEPTPTPKPISKPKPEPPKEPVESREKPKPAARPVGAVIEARPDYASNPPPPYPETARRNGWQGKVMVRATVNAQGKVERVALARGSGYAILDQAALDAVRRWRFKAKTVAGVATGSTVEVPVNFSLRR